MGDFGQHVLDSCLPEIQELRAENARLREEVEQARAAQRELHRRTQEAESTAHQKLRSNFFSGEASLPDTLEGWRVAAARRMRDYLMVRNWWRTDCDLYRGQRDAERARAEAAEQRNEDLVRMLDVAVRNASEAAGQERDDIVEALWSMEEAQLRDDDRRVVRRAIRLIESRNAAERRDFEAGRAAERRDVVAWLREMAARCVADHRPDLSGYSDAIAGAIESGAHLPAKERGE
jgi:cell division septum initiation protein DivIVA